MEELEELVKGADEFWGLSEPRLITAAGSATEMAAWVKDSKRGARESVPSGPRVIGPRAEPISVGRDLEQLGRFRSRALAAHADVGGRVGV